MISQFRFGIFLTIALMLFSVSAAKAHEGMHGTHADMGKSGKAMPAKPQLATSVMFDTKGRLWQVSTRDGYVLVSYSDDKGKNFSIPAKVNRDPENIAAEGDNRPKIFANKDGSIYVSYTQSLAKPYSGNIRFSRSIDGGKTFSEPITVNDNREMISHRFDALGVNERGQIYIAWLDKRDSSAAEKKGQKYTGAAVYYAVSENGGERFSHNIQAAEHSCECCRISMAIEPDGTPVIFWRHVYGKNVRDHAMLRLDGKSQPLRVTYDKWEVDACPHHGPSMAISSDGIYHFVWFDNAPGKNGLFYAHSMDGGKTFSSPMPFGNNGAQAAHPYVLSLGAKIFVVWKEFDGENAVVIAMSSENAGQTWSVSQRLAATAGSSDHPLLVADGATAYLSWNTAKEGFQLVKVPLEVAEK